MRRVCTAIALLAAAGAVLVGQDRGGRFQSGVDLISVTATVVDKEGHLVTGLPAEAFEIFEQGERQTISQFTNERVPVSLAVLLDVSDSMFGQRIRDACAAVERFLLELLSEEDALFVMTFNHNPNLLTPWITPGEAPTVRSALDTLRPSGGTAIYDTVIASLGVIEHRPRDRAALVLISDGADTASDASLRDVRSALLRTDAFIFAIAIDSPFRQAINTRVNPEALGEITNQTGGHTEVVHDMTELAAATSRIADELNTQYVMGYSSPHPGDGKYHSIRVRVKGEGFKVRSRNGYVSVPVKKD